MNSTTTREAQIAQAREVDTRIAAEWDAYYTARAEVEHQQANIQKNEKYIVQAAGRAYAARMVESAEASIKASEARIAQLQATMEVHSTEAMKIERDEYTGWTRFFLVKHIHNSQHCSSFRPTTRVGWLPSLSGQTEAEAVAEHGAILCTICFPSAPVEYTRGHEDESCAGSGSSIDRDQPHRVGFYSGNWATCGTCGQRVTVTRGMKLRKHK